MYNLSVARILFFLIVLTACKEDTINPQSFGSISGTVQNEDDQVLLNVTIETTPATAVLLTDSSGSFTLENIPVGEYTVIAKKEEYRTKSTSISVSENTTTEITITLEQSTPSRSDIPNKPLQPTPSNQSTGIADSVTLHWTVANPERNAELTYDVLLFTSGNPVGRTIAEGLSDTTYLLGDLMYNTTYFWQVIAKDQYGNETSSELWSFQTMSFPEIAIVYTREVDGNTEIYGTDQALMHHVRLTENPSADVFPQINPVNSSIAYIADADGRQQLFIMNQNGTDNTQVTQIPIDGYHNYGDGYCWSPDGGKLLYSHYNELYRINNDGTGLQKIATAPDGRHFKSCDWSGSTDKIVVQTIGSNINNSELYLMNEDGSNKQLILDDTLGALGNPSFSIDGKNIVFSMDVAEPTAPTGRQLDAHIFLLNLNSGALTDLSANKPEGTNDTYPSFSPTGAYIIFENGSNELNAEKNIWRMDLTGANRELLIENGKMPDWE